jgi:hypothetical protein
VQGSTRIVERHRGGAPAREPAARGHRGPLMDGHERRRRPLRRGQDVPAAGREERARDEEGGRLSRCRTSRPRSEGRAGERARSSRPR